MKREDLVQEVRHLLARTGFFLTDPQLVPNQVFDFVGRRDATLVVVKCLLNGDSLTREAGDQILQVGQLLRASPLVVAVRSSRGKLDDGVVYLRHNAPLVSLETVKDFLVEGVPPIAFAGPGGTFVSVDQGALRSARRQRQLSLDALAREVGLSRRAIQLYEEGMSAAVQAADRLEKFFGQSFTVPIDPFHYRWATSAGEPEGDKVSPFEAYVFRTLQEHGWRVTQAARCPFDAVAESPAARLLSGVETDRARVKLRARSIAALSSVAETEGVLFVREGPSAGNVAGTPVVTRSELDRAEAARDIVDLIRSKKQSR